MALLNQRYSLSLSFSPPVFSHHFLTPRLLFVIAKAAQKRSTFKLCSSTSNDSCLIFLPFLQNQHKSLESPVKKETHKPECNNIEETNDPILKFFKTQTSDCGTDPDPAEEGGLSLQKKLNTSWHLASAFGEPNPENELQSYNLALPENANPDLETPSKAEGVVGEILDIVRRLPENVTLGEVLDGHDFGGRIGEEECVEVLKMLDEEGMVISCLYFFEWMGLNEPRFVSPRSCCVLFPILGKAGKGNELLSIFRNLPFNQKPQFQDVRVYNAAILGLSYCGRYETLT